MVSTFREAIGFLDQIGFLNVLLPFIFIYVIVFAILEKTKVLGIENKKPRTNLNAMVAFCIGFIFIASASRVESLTTYIQFIGMAAAGMTCFFYLLAAFQQKLFFKKTTWGTAIVFVFITFAFMFAMGWLNHRNLDTILPIIFHPVVVIIAVFLIILWYVTGAGLPSLSSKKEQSTESKNLDDVLKEVDAKKVGTTKF